MTLPHQSCDISSTNFWPKPVEPRGLGAATIQPCAAHSDGFHRLDHASAQSPCGPPCSMKTTGYFFVGSKCGGLSSQYCTSVPLAPFTVMLAGFGMSTDASHAAFSWLNCRERPAASTTKISAGARTHDTPYPRPAPPPNE